MFLIGFEAWATLGLYIVSAILLAGVEMRREFVRAGRLSLPAVARAVVRSVCTVVLALTLHWAGWRQLVSERWYEGTLSSLYMKHVVLCLVCVGAAYAAVGGGIALAQATRRRSSTPSQARVP